MGNCGPSLDSGSASAPGSTSRGAASSSAIKSHLASTGALASTMGSFVFSNPNKRREQASELLGSQAANAAVEYKCVCWPIVCRIPPRPLDLAEHELTAFLSLPTPI